MKTSTGRQLPDVRFCGSRQTKGVIGADASHFSVTMSPPDQATVDHRMPRGRGGPDTIENCVSACRQCNEARNHSDVLLPGHKGPAPKIPTTEDFAAALGENLQAARRRSPAAKCATSTQSAVPCRPPDIPQPAVSGRSLTAPPRQHATSVSLRDVGFTSNRGDRCPADFKRCRSIAAT